VTVPSALKMGGFSASHTVNLLDIALLSVLLLTHALLPLILLGGPRVDRAVVVLASFDDWSHAGHSIVCAVEGSGFQGLGSRFGG
jgi:hypothetical protein